LLHCNSRQFQVEPAGPVGDLRDPGQKHRANPSGGVIDDPKPALLTRPSGTSSHNGIPESSEVAAEMFFPIGSDSSQVLPPERCLVGQPAPVDVHDSHPEPSLA
jgi:hypothetical protein